MFGRAQKPRFELYIDLHLIAPNFLLKWVNLLSAGTAEIYSSHDADLKAVKLCL
jgi:hypothetical protein